jgi:hypothetical protein
VVGAFVPFLKELKRRGQPILVLEQDAATLKADELPFFRQAEQAPEILPEADVVLITGSTLVNNTLEDLLALARPEARVTIVGQTVGMLPDAFLARGADVLGCVKITAPDTFLDLLAEGDRATISSAARRRRSCSRAGPSASIPGSHKTGRTAPPIGGSGSTLNGFASLRSRGEEQTIHRVAVTDLSS